MAKRVQPHAQLSNDNQIEMYLHCGLCIEEYKAEAQRVGRASPAEMARLNVGWTPRGLQVWCQRHNCNVLNVDFEGHKHPADATRRGH